MEKNETDKSVRMKMLTKTDKDYGYVHLCPSCEEFLCMCEDKCPKCGQLLDWRR